ncbi:MAG TPA: FtsX-like permease family protein, partial [Vicinamibacterales bacterium]|nr:FtsX-like permease family protein [Vicinamibacterales bacterium]
PIGRRLRFGGTTAGAWTTIIGVVGDVRHSALDAPPPPEVYVYTPRNQPTNPFIVLRTAVDEQSIAGAVRGALKAVDKDIASNDIRPMEDVLSASMAQRRFVLLLAASFGVLALLMTAVGVYGVMALIVTERAPEVAIRLALGARRSGVLALVLRQGLALAGSGIAIGLLSSILLAPALRSQLYGVRPADPLTFAGVPLLVLAIAALACLIPAVRTITIDPVSALRAE